MAKATLIEFKPQNKLETAWQDWKMDQNDDKAENLLNMSRPVMQAAIRSYAGGRTDPVIDLESKRLIMDSFRTFDPHRGVKLRTYLLRQLQPLTRVVHARAQELKVPQQAWMDMRNVKRTEEEYLQKFGEPPSIGELADETGLSRTRIQYLKKFRSTGIPESVLRKGSPQEYSAPGVENDDFWVEAVYHSSDPRDQKIYDWKTGSHGEPKLSNKEIAKKLKISESAISQRTTYLINQLRRYEE